MFKKRKIWVGRGKKEWEYKEEIENPKFSEQEEKGKEWEYVE
jgi:hypothetical protein